MNLNYNILEIIPPIHMVVWCLLIMGIIGVRRLHELRQYLIMAGLSFLMIFFSWMIPLELIKGTGVNLFDHPPMGDPAFYLNLGTKGLLILLINPIGWMSPLLGYAIARKVEEPSIHEESLLEAI